VPAAHRRAAVPALLAAGIILATVQAARGDCPGADPEALDWLDRMGRSVHQLSYQGVVTLQRGGDDMQVMQVAHRIEGDATTEQLVRLTGQGVRVDRRGHPLSCVHPGHQLLRIGERLRSGDCGLAESYRFSLDGRDRIAGRNAVRLRVEPRDMYRLGYILYLDSTTGLLLKTETLGSDGLILEKYQFASLSYGDGAPGTTDVEHVHHAGHPHPGEPSLDSPVGREWSLRWLPGGFEATDAPQGLSGRRTYTDGLAVFSVFLEHLDSEIRSGEGVAREGGTISYTRGMTLSGEPVLVTVIGEIPVNAARMVASSVSWVR